MNLKKSFIQKKNTSFSFGRRSCLNSNPKHALIYLNYEFYMSIEKKILGLSSGHKFQSPQEIYSYKMTNNNGIDINTMSFGASVTDFMVKKKERTFNIVKKFDDFSQYEKIQNNTLMGTSLGRFARCIENGKFFIDGTEFQLSCNENGHHFHGGYYGFHVFNWESTFFEDKDSCSVVYSLNSPDGDQGYPGEVNIKTTYKLYNNNDFEIIFEAETTKTTLIGLSNHVFWNLDESSTINNHVLNINSTDCIPMNKEFIPNGPPISVVGKTNDFLKARSIDESVLDICYVFDEPGLFAELYSSLSDIRIKVYSDQKVMAMYSGDFLEDKRSGIAFQPGPFPNAPNYSNEFPSILRPGQSYKQHFKVTIE